MAKTLRHEGLKSYFGDEDHLQISQTKTFAEMVFELLSEKKPSPKELRLFELILNLSIDHGQDTPSAVATIEAATEGKSLSEAVASGLLQINSFHGGAVEPAMEIYYQIKKGETSADKTVKEHLAEDKRIPGLGHRIYKEEDPRTKLIFEKMVEMGFPDEFIKIAKEVENEMEVQKGRKLPVNIDGSIAVLLCTLGWDVRLANAVFIIARVPGLCGQYINSNRQ